MPGRFVAWHTDNLESVVVDAAAGSGVPLTEVGGGVDVSLTKNIDLKDINLKQKIILIILLFCNLLLFGQETIDFQAIVSRNKVCFSLLNVTSDTLRLPSDIMMPEFRNKPNLDHDFQFKEDTFYILLFDYLDHVVTSNGAPANIRIDGERMSFKLPPNKTYKFYMKIKHAQKQFKGIRNIAIKTNWVIPGCKTQSITFGRCRMKTSKYHQWE